MRPIALLVALVTLAVACAPARPVPAVAPSAVSPSAAPAAPAEASGRSVAGSPAASAAESGTSPSAAPPPPAPAAPAAQLFGPLAPTILEVPAWVRSEPFARPRTLNLPAGFHARLFAAGLAGPRLLAFDDRSVLHVTQTRAGSVVALPDRDGDGTADEVVTVREGLDRPHGMAFREGWLYVAENSRVVRLRGDGDALPRSRLDLVVDGLPSGGGHFTRTLGFGPDGGMYVAVGSSCNVCREQDPRRAAIVRYEPDGSGERVYAKGLRNAVDFTWRPGTAELWATNNGRDYMGDDLPPETLNLVRDGDDFGWPGCHAGRLSDPEFGGPRACNGVAAPRAEMQAHSAPLGLAFYPNASSVIVALHGSWNRSVPAAPRLAHVVLHPDGQAEVEDFATGWQLGAGEASRWGRPVGAAVGPDGSLYVSDDLAGAIYRITADR